MRTKLIANPFYCYILSFGTALYIYSWSWSEIYPLLTTEVVLFLLASFLISYSFGKKIDYKIIYTKLLNDPYNNIITLLIILSYLLEFAYNGGVPIFLIFSGADVAYMDFGIPTFHVMLHTFTSFYTIYTFHQFLSTKRRRLLVFVIILLIPNILIVNRGAIIMTMTACLVIHLFSIKQVLLKSIIILFIGGALFFYGFGYIGNARSFNGDPGAFMKVTKATDEFTEGNIPNEYYWFYIYASSPFANFQNATITSTKHRYDVLTFVTWEFLPDFISKRIVPIEADYDGVNRLDYSINPILTVGSIYFEPYIRMGWYGPIFLFLFYMLLMYTYINSISPQSKYFVTAIAILCVISIFNIFENMLNFSGLCFQLLYPILLSKLEKYKVKFTLLDKNLIKLNLTTKKIRFKA